MMLMQESGHARIVPIAGIHPAPENLQLVLREAIESVIDREALNHEIEAEKEDAAHLDALRRRLQVLLAEVNIQGGGTGV
jgi:hypothetical protein